MNTEYAKSEFSETNNASSLSTAPTKMQVKELLIEASKRFTGSDWEYRYAEYMAPKVNMSVQELENTLSLIKAEQHTKWEAQVGKDEDWPDYYAEMLLPFTQPPATSRSYAQFGE